jgi:ClpP class serine protease
LDVAALEPIAGGRVWTGAMAKEHGLVDELGDFALAVDRARELASLPADKRPLAIGIAPPRKFVLPVPQTATAMAIGLTNIRALLPWFTCTRTWAVMPWQIEKSY